MSVLSYELPSFNAATKKSYYYYYNMVDFIVGDYEKPATKKELKIHTQFFSHISSLPSATSITFHTHRDDLMSAN